MAMRSLWRGLVVLLLVAGLATVSGCGRKGKLEREPGQEEPHTYPAN
jgi:predicted small lipoprotein YifL